MGQCSSKICGEMRQLPNSETVTVKSCSNVDVETDKNTAESDAANVVMSLING